MSAGADITPGGQSAAVAAPAPAIRLLDVLLAGLRAAQTEFNCFMCLTSDDPRDVCAEHRERLAAIVNYGASVRPTDSKEKR